MDLKLNGLTVVVTGGSFGIGAAIVKAFLEEGAHVAFCSRSACRVEAMLSSLDKKANVTAKVLDVTDIHAFSSWIKSLSSVDILVPNVSALSGIWDEAINVDLNATVGNIDVVLPYLEKSAFGAITYIGSKAGSFPTPGLDAYGAVKAAMIHYMKTLSKKLMPKNIRVNTVSPGDTYFPGGFWDKASQSMPEIYEQTLTSNPMGRLCTPEEVAKVVAFISSPVASFVSGVNWLVDGAATNHIQI